MNRVLKLIVLTLSISCLTGCGFNMFPVSNQNISRSDVLLQNNNFRVLGEAYGSASATYVIGIGGLSQKAKDNAVSSMYRNARLSGAQTIVNINVHQHIGGVFPFYFQVQYIATGQIVEFIE